MTALPRLVLWGDGESPHLLKWAHALAPRVELFIASSRGLAPELIALAPAAQRLALGCDVRFSGGNVALLKSLPRLVRWLRGVDADWINAHYLSSHGTMAWLARRFGVRAQLAASAWGSDILVAPERSRALRWATRQVLRDSAIATSDSEWMAHRMRALGANRVMTFPFGLDALPPDPGPKEPRLFFANRGLEEIYDPRRVLRVFGRIATAWPDARLVVANSGSLQASLKAEVQAAGLSERIVFVGRLDSVAQAAWYARARWYLSLPRSDSVSVSVLEAMAHGCVPLLSDLPANRELVRSGENGVILTARRGCVGAADENTIVVLLDALAARADTIAKANRAWVRTKALFEPCIANFVTQLKRLTPAPQYGAARRGSRA